MNSPKSYRKYQKFYELVLPIVGLSALFAWDGDLLIKIPLAIILYRSCVSWSELAALERGSQEREVRIFELLTKEKSGEIFYESESSSWAAFIGLLLQILVTVGISVVIAQFI